MQFHILPNIPAYCVFSSSIDSVDSNLSSITPCHAVGVILVTLYKKAVVTSGTQCKVSLTPLLETLTTFSHKIKLTLTVTSSLFLTITLTPLNPVNINHNNKITKKTLLLWWLWLHGSVLLSNITLLIFAVLVVWCSQSRPYKAFGTVKFLNNSYTHTHPFTSPLSGTTQVSRYQQGKTNMDFTEARDSEWQWHQLGRMQVCTSLQTDNHASTPPLSFLQAGCPSCRPSNSVKALKSF